MKVWNPEISEKEMIDLAYWERNMLALRYADGWYNDDVPSEIQSSEGPVGWQARIYGWRRVLSLEGGTITFHIPDGFSVGNLRYIDPNWDGHTTEQKWERIALERGVK